MFRGFRHTLFLMLQVGVVASGAAALAVQPQAWTAILVCVGGTLLASWLCERAARHYLKSTLGRLRRVAEEIGHGRHAQLVSQPGDDFHKMVNAINLLATRLAEAREEESRLQDELRRRERLAFLGELAATVAHEVNNPLDGVQSCVRILRRSLDDGPRAQQMLGLIDDGLARIELIVRRLLTLARESSVRAAPTPIWTVLEAALRAAHARLDGRQIRVVRDNQTDSDLALLDAPLAEHAFVNLIINAADSMSEGGTLTLRTRRGEVGVDGRAAAMLVDVADTGHGISPDVLPHIFEPFFTTKAGGRGTGLGLSLAARVVDAHGGLIDVSSNDGSGTVFTVRLPAAAAIPAVRPAERAAGAVPAGAAAR
jgi:signal transduction histidine kinase